MNEAIVHCGPWKRAFRATFIFIIGPNSGIQWLGHIMLGQLCHNFRQGSNSAEI